jgi:hypothetical protein
MMTRAQRHAQAAAARNARNARASRISARDAARSDLALEAFSHMTAQQVRDYVNANVTDLASARTLLRRLALMVWALVRVDQAHGD